LKILRFSDRDILKNVDGVCEAITEKIRDLPPHINPLPAGERKKE
jgi:very-short-patch-repair endonuclease